MTKLFVADSLKLDSGPRITTGAGYPIAGAGIPAEIGSYYACQLDGTWWQKVKATDTGWVQLRVVSAVNGDTVNLLPGMPVASSGDDFIRASSSSLVLSVAVGLVVIGAAPGLVAQALPVGLTSLTTAEWDAVTGQVGGLTSGASYYLGGLGLLTMVAPTSVGSVVSEIGHAVSSTGMLVIPRAPILL